MPPLNKESHFSRLFVLEDDRKDGRLKFRTYLSEVNERKPKLHLEIDRYPDEVYHDSKYEKVIFPEPTTKLVFNIYETMRFVALLVEATSFYLAEVRETVYQDSKLADAIELENGDYNIRMLAVKKKHRENGKSVNSSRFNIIIENKASGEEMLVVKLKRSKIVWLLHAIKSMFSESVKSFAVPFDDLEGHKRLMVKYDDHVAIGEVWIHGREIQKFQDFIERVVFDFTFKVGYGGEFFRYRQVLAKFATEEGLNKVAKIQLSKMTHDHKPYLDDNGNKVNFSFLVISSVVAKLFLLLPSMLSDVYEDDKELGYRSTSGEVQAFDAAEDSLPETGEGGLIEEDDVKIVDVLEKSAGSVYTSNDGDYLLNLIESQLAFKVEDGEFNIKKGLGKITFFGRYRDGALEDQSFVVKKINVSSEDLEEVEKLPKFSEDLGREWLNIISVIAESLHHKKTGARDEMNGAANDYGQVREMWNFRTTEVGPMLDSVEMITIIKLLIDPTNKAPTVLTIDRFQAGENSFTGEPENIHVGRMRVPLFKEHIRSLLKGFVHLASLFENYYYSKDVHFYRLDDNDRKKLTFSIKRSFNSDGDEEVMLGDLGGALSRKQILTEPDRQHLMVSAYQRLLYGRWVQFSGEHIAVSFDGYLTDDYNEYKLELDQGETRGAGGSLAALAILFSTVHHKKRSENASS